MRSYHVYTGDGNEGTYYSYTTQAKDMDAAVAYVRSDLRTDVDWDEDGDEHQTTIYALTGPDGETAINGGSWIVIDIYDAETCPRSVPSPLVMG